MHAQMKRDERGLPVVSWREPRLKFGSALFGLFIWERVPVYAAKVWIEPGRDGEEVMFVMRHDAHQGVVGVPLARVCGFSLHTSDELYRDGARPRISYAKAEVRRDYRDDLVLIAEFDRPVNGVSFLPLTLTCAARSDVMSLHAVLNDVFVAGREGVLAAAMKAREAWMEERLARFARGLVKEPIAVEGRRFVGGTLRPYASERDRKSGQPWRKDWEGGVEVSRHTTPGSGSYLGYVHIFERQREGARAQWESLNSLSVVDPACRSWPDVIGLDFYGEDGLFCAHKLREGFRGIEIMRGDELALPREYRAAADAVMERETIIACMAFADGELLPLGHFAPSVRGEVDQLLAEIEALVARREIIRV